MAVILQVTYSKKLGLPQFSSHSCSVSITTEIQDVNQAGPESSKLYQLLQDAVDKDIQQVGFLPDPTYGVRNNGSNGNGHHPKPSLDRWNCTEGQKGFILRILNENNISKENTEDLANQLFGLGVKQINKMQASQLIEELLIKSGQPPQKNRWRKPQTANGS